MEYQKTIMAILESLDIKETARAVYMDLLTHGASTARIIAQRLSLPRSSVYDHLAPLTARGLVTEKDTDGKTFFEVHDVRDLGRLIGEREDELTLLRARFEHMKGVLPPLPGSGDPKVKFFEGKEGLHALLDEMLWDAGSCIQTVWPYHEMLKVFGTEKLVSFNEKRVRRKIKLESIWVNAKQEKKHLWHGADDFVVRKIAPKSCKTPMGYSIYGNRVAFMSSLGELYGFVVHSADFAALMRMQFALLSSVSR